jgi:hypothetical protein
VTVTGNSVVKTSGCEGYVDADAVFGQQLSAARGFAEFTVPDASLVFVAADARLSGHRLGVLNRGSVVTVGLGADGCRHPDGPAAPRLRDLGRQEANDNQADL